MVRRPAIYEFNGEPTLNQVLDLAGGVLVSASLKQINVARIEAYERRTMLNLQLTGTADETNKRSPASRCRVGMTCAISADSALQRSGRLPGWACLVPGKYTYRDGMTINDLLKSYQDIMPEPADHAEIIRLQ